MKAFFIAISLLCGIYGGYAQYPKWIIQFTDKHNSPYSITNPSAYLSAKAIARRTRYSILIDSTDLPVNPDYIQQVVAMGNVTYLAQSKWLNQILIYCTDNTTINKINSLPFVKASEAIGNFAPMQQNQFGTRTPDDVHALDISAAITNAEQDSLDYASSYNQVHMHDGEFLHNKAFTGDGMTIALLDGGFFHYKELSAFDSVRNAGHILGIRDFVAFDSSVDEDDPHGMYCLSTIAANIPGTMVGTAPHASFYLLRTENVASEYPIEEFNWVAGAEYADSAGADMITSSLGYFYFDDPSFNHSYADIYAGTTTVSKGAAMAAKKGMIVTNSAGNEGSSAWKYILFPADADSVCAVGAVDANGNIASFSSYGYPGKVKPNIVSVGVNTTIFGTNNQPVSGSGTSFSNPNINGLIACLWEAFPAYNNMTILNAVYQSADRYTNPDDRYGYGIPNMKTAYLILKKKQNTELYGNDWLFANPDPFNDSIHIKLIGQVDGTVQLSLIDPNGNTVRTISLTTEQEEVYDTAFHQLTLLPAGNYVLQYADSITMRTIALTKTGPALNDWIIVYPVPFTKQLNVYFKAQETGKVNIRLIDASGKTIETKTLNVTSGNYYTVNFTSAAFLSKGIYFIQYAGSTRKPIKITK